AGVGDEAIIVEDAARPDPDVKTATVGRIAADGTIAGKRALGGRERAVDGADGPALANATRIAHRVRAAGLIAAELGQGDRQRPIEDGDGPAPTFGVIVDGMSARHDVFGESAGLNIDSAADAENAAAEGIAHRPAGLVFGDDDADQGEAAA